MNAERIRPPYGWAAAAGAVVLATYVATLAPTTAFWDTSEYIAAAKVLGIPHPPGNPLFTIMAHVFGLLPIASSYAVRINLFAALTSAAAAGLWFLVAERWMREIVPVRWARLAASFAGVLVGATAWTVWNQSTVNEKVYTVSLFSIALVMWLAVHWADDADAVADAIADAGGPNGAGSPRRDRWIVLIAYVLALTSTNHLMGVLAAPAVAVYVLWTDWRVLTRPRTLAAIVGALIVGISINYIFLPMRAGQYPPINEGEPVGFFSQALSDVLNRQQYGKPSVFERQADIPAQFANYWQYWTWQWAFDWEGIRPLATGVFTALGLGGLVALWRRDRRAAVAAATLMATLTFALVFYLNFRYGFSIYPDQTGLSREVRERDYFFIASFAAWGTLVAVGFGAMMQAIVGFLRERGTPAGRWAAATPVLALALVPLLANRETASRAHETIARDFAVDLLESVEPYGILITAGDNDTFPLWYAQEVEGIRRDVTLANLSLMNTRWHLRQLRRRETPDFDLSRSVALWGRDVPERAAGADSAPRWTKPTEPVFSLSEQELSDTIALPDVMRVPGAGLRFDSLQIAFGSDVLFLQDLATIFLIRDNLGERPIYFSWTTGNYPDQTLGLTPYLVSHGLVRKLHAAPVAPSDSVRVSPSLGLVNVPRSNRLLWDVYHWRSAARERPHGWVDVPSASILQMYAVVYGGTGPVLAQVGDTAAAAKADSVARAVMESLQPK